MLVFILILALLFPQAEPAPQKVNIIFVSPPGESWTQAEQSRAIGAVLDATGWWTRNSKVAVPSFELGWTSIITPTDFSYSLFTWERPHYSYPPSALTVFVIDNSTTHKTMDGALGWSQAPCWAVTAVLGDDRDELAAIVAHEYGHAVLGLGHAPLAAFDIMTPALPLEAYRANVIGYYTRRAMGESFRTFYLAHI